MIGLLIGFMMLFLQPADTTSTLPVLHDSLVTGNYNTIFFSDIKGWRFSPKDNPDFSSPEYDDSDWYTVTKPFSDPEAVPDSLWNGFGWFRLSFKVDSSFSLRNSLFRSNDTMGALATMGAVEVFVNDSLIIKKGNPSPDYESQVLYGKSVDIGTHFEWIPDRTYQIAIRTSFHKFNRLNRLSLGRFSSPFDINLNIRDIDETSSIRKENTIFATLQASAATILLMIMFLHLSLYLRTRDDSSNFWVFLISLTIFIQTFFYSIFYSFNIESFITDVIINSIRVTAQQFSISLIPLVIHKLLKVSVPRFWKIFAFFPLVLIIIIVSIPEFFHGGALAIQNNVMMFIAFTGGVMALLKARKQNKEDLALLAFPILSYPLIFLTGYIYLIFLGLGNSYTVIVTIFLLFIIMPIGMSLYQGKQFLRLHNKMDHLVDERTSELQEAYNKLEQSHKDLREAQQQLILQEKLASLGQLTAGIAHEIKNPLNFVTNFSEVSLELLDEAREEVKNSPFSRGEADSSPGPDLILEILDDIEANLRKIHEHGSRADGIVKSMLQHSRGGSGKMEPTPLNPLIKEYVNLAFHGMRAGYDPINVDIELDLDETIGEVPLIGEDFSRVILNLCNNAFDAMREKLSENAKGKGEKSPLEGSGEAEQSRGVSSSLNYHPNLTVRTHRNDQSVTIEIEDNGPGIPDEIKDKILQPFFTTKKGTQGTGLGLSITHDIVKAHGGELEVKSKSGEFAEFTIRLPVKKDVN